MGSATEFRDECIVLEFVTFFSLAGEVIGRCRRADFILKVDSGLLEEESRVEGAALGRSVEDCKLEASLLQWSRRLSPLCRGRELGMRPGEDCGEQMAASLSGGEVRTVGEHVEAKTSSGTVGVGTTEECWLEVHPGSRRFSTESTADEPETGAVA